ncbi:MAG: hypothetical protein QNL33_17525 [Akkermansiaceae bacterium]
MINRERKADGTTSLEKIGPNGPEGTPTFVPCAFDNNMLELKIPLLTEWQNKPLSFDFHASDNAPFDDSYFTKGDHAPDRRFNFRFQSQ